MQGALITIEGIEGAGKSSVCSGLAEMLRAAGREVLLTHEPGGTELGRKIRELLLDPGMPQTVSGAELLLFAADRAQHLAEKIRPALRAGAVVLCDRYIHSTFAYQGYGRGMDLKQLAQLHEFIGEVPQPDLVLVLDVDPAIGLDRVRRRVSERPGDALTKFEVQELDFHHRVREGYLQLAQAEPARFLVVDGSRTHPEVLAEATAAIRRLLPGM